MTWPVVEIINRYVSRQNSSAPVHYSTGTTAILAARLPLRWPEATDPPSTFEHERAAFFVLLPNLAEYVGRFVAIHRAQVVDADVSQRGLAQRFFAKHGNVPVYIGFVGRRRPVRVPTPIIRRQPE